MTAIYDEIGTDYAAARRTDSRIGTLISCAIGSCATVVNVGAGAGSYEPADKRVVAVEPSMTMIRQRGRDAAPVVQAVAEALPFRDAAFDCALAILTLHHWSDPAAGVRELCRVARERVVILLWDQGVWEKFWLISEYLPHLRDFDRRRVVPIATVTSLLGECEVWPVPIPHDCTDGFQGAFWRRPEAYLDARVRARMSGFAQAHPDDYMAGLRALAADLENGTWHKRHEELMQAETHDLGYRLIVGRRP